MLISDIQGGIAGLKIYTTVVDGFIKGYRDMTKKIN